VPGLAAKPIIDMDIVVASSEQVTPAIQRLAAIGYRWRGDLGIIGREAFDPRSKRLYRVTTSTWWSRTTKLISTTGCSATCCAATPRPGSGMGRSAGQRGEGRRQLVCDI
jgi:GrpB-like predicted nucleotidyltransferase (UPF0157 family)